jgi:hypothetical protein
VPSGFVSSTCKRTPFYLEASAICGVIASIGGQRERPPLRCPYMRIRGAEQKSWVQPCCKRGIVRKLMTVVALAGGRRAKRCDTGENGDS